MAKSFREEAKKSGITPLERGSFKEAAQKAGVKPVSGFPENEPPEIKQDLLTRIDSAFNKVLNVPSKVVAENTGKVAGTLIGRTGASGEEAQQKANEVDITKGDVALAALETVPFTKTGKAITKAALSPLTRVATKLYQSALKPVVSTTGKTAAGVTAARKELARIGLDEKVWLTQGGVERVATKIDDMEQVLQTAIDEGKAAGKTIPTAKLSEHLDDLRNTFSNIADVDAGKAAVKEINQLSKSFVKKYGKEIPIDKAQEIKTATYNILRKSYGKLSTVNDEAQKQIARYLKEGIVDASPAIGTVNKRLKSLYAFDQALAKASGRLGNLNLLGLGAKIGGVTGGARGGVIGALLDLADKPALKSGAGIALDQLTKGAVGARIPAAVVLKNLADLIRGSDSQQQE